MFTSCESRGGRLSGCKLVSKGSNSCFIASLSTLQLSLPLSLLVLILKGVSTLVCILPIKQRLCLNNMQDSNRFIS